MIESFKKIAAVTNNEIFHASMEEWMVDAVETHETIENRRPVYITIRCVESIDVRIADAIRRKGNALSAFMADVDEVRAQGLKQRALDMVRAL